MLRLLKFLPLLLILLSSAAMAQDTSAAPSQSASELQKLFDEGFAAENKYDWSAAILAYEKAREMAKAAKNVRVEANALGNIGGVYSDIGQPQKALEFYQQALPLFKEIKNQIGEARTYINIGKIYQDIRQPQKALELYQQSSSLFRQTGDKNGEASTLINIGSIYEEINQPQKALASHHHALLLFKEVGNKTGEASTLTNIGIVYTDIDQPQKALEFYQQALPLHQQIGNKVGEANTLTNIGTAYHNLNQFQKALEFYRQALPLHQQTKNKTSEAKTLTLIGNIYIRCMQYHQAENSLQAALLLVEQLRGAIGGSAENRQEYLASVLRTYTALIFVQAELKEYDRAFATLGKMKGRSLLDQGQRTRSLLTALPAEAKDHLRKLWREVDGSSLAMIAAEQRGGKIREEAQLRLVSAEQALQMERDALFARYPEILTEAKTIALADVPKFLPADTALLEYTHLSLQTAKKKRDSHLLFIVTTEKGKPVLTVHSLTVKQTELAQLAEQFRQSCAKPTRSYKPLAQRLAGLLLPGDARKRLVGKKRLVICPEGAVWSVPFAALLLPNGRHLVERYEIDYAYSAAGVQAALTVTPAQAQGTLILANPDFGTTSRFGDSLPKQIAQGVERPLSEPSRPISDPARPLSEPSRFASIIERGKIKPLPGTKVEADAIHHLYPNATLLTGRQAQESELVKALPHYRYLHFATHGLFSDTAPLQSAIVLAQPLKNSPDDGFLTAREIYEMTLHAEMAVLSACETARGVNKDGEGVVGLTWALFAAGVPTQVVSQWKVSDASTPELMTAFYGNLKSGQSKGKALRSAALKMMHDGRHSHPYHWAAFVLFGDWR